MSVSIYRRKGRKPVYLVHKVINGKQYSKTYPLTEQGYISALGHQCILNDMGKLNNSIKERKFFNGNKVRGLNLKYYKINGKLQLAFRLKVVVETKALETTRTITTKENVLEEFDLIISILRKHLDIDSRTWVSMKRNLNEAYFHYLKKYCELTNTQF